MMKTENADGNGLRIRAGRVAVQGGHVAYRMREGPTDQLALVVFHQSPLSGWTHTPLFDHLAHSGSVILFDTPGYGDSSHARDLKTIDEYAFRLGEALEQLRGDRRVVVLGQHTGGHLAMLYAADNAETTAGVIFNGVALYTDAERGQRAARYAPRVAPGDDGEHVATFWKRIRELYPAVDLATCNRMLADYLLAEPDYAHAYRAVFACDVEPVAKAFAATGIPSRVIVGSEDVIHHMQQRVCERFGSDMVTLPGLTDFAALEAPALFAAAVDDFITSVDAGPSH